MGTHHTTLSCCVFAIFHDREKKTKIIQNAVDILGSVQVFATTNRKVISFIYKVLL